MSVPNLKVCLPFSQVTVSAYCWTYSLGYCGRSRKFGVPKLKPTEVLASWMKGGRPRGLVYPGGFTNVFCS